jgi:ABC-type Fe3+/spermidine/putrescine transport system ATPase subunit
MPEITLDGLYKKYGGTWAADGLTLSVRNGEYLCILGPTGSGKTTCLRMICGLTKPDKGKVLFSGSDVTNTPVSERKATMLSQAYSLFPPMTVYENVKFSPQIKEWKKEDARQLVRSMIKMVHLEKKARSYPLELSGGQQQRTALARALASGSDILLLDEPLRALDARLRLELRQDLKSLVKEMGLTAIHVTHDQDEALEMADRIAVIRKGKIVQIGTPREVFLDPKTPFVANFLGRSNVFLGKVLSSNDLFSEIAMENGTLIKARATRIPPGTEVAVTIKIGSTRIPLIPRPTEEKPDPDMPEGFFAGKVERVLYEGATITVEVSVKDIGLISSKLPNRKFDDYNIGSEVVVTWTPEMASVFEIPPEGIDEELRLD